MKALGTFLLQAALALGGLGAALASVPASEAQSPAATPPSAAAPSPAAPGGPIEAKRDALLERLSRWTVFFPENLNPGEDETSRRLFALRTQFWDIGRQVKEAKTEEELHVQQDRFETLKRSLTALLYPQTEDMTEEQKKRFVDDALTALNALRAKKRLAVHPADVAELRRLTELARTAMDAPSLERLFTGPISGFGFSASAPTSNSPVPAAPPLAPGAAPAAAGAPPAGPADAQTNAWVQSYLRSRWAAGAAPRSGSLGSLPAVPSLSVTEPPSPFAYRDVPNLDDLRPEQVTKIARRLGWTKSEVTARIRKARQFNVDWKLALATGKDPRILDRVLQRSQEKNIDPMLMLAMMKQESGGNTAAVSPRGAAGLMQIMPDTGRWLARMEGMRRYNLFNADDNIRLSARYLRYLSDLFHGATNLVLAAYNAGEHAVEKYHGIPPYRETRAYVRNIFNYIGDYKARINDITQILSNA